MNNVTDSSRDDKRASSAMSSKQLAWTVTQGRKVAFRFSNSDPIEGYLCGMDDSHWMVITSEGRKHLIHQGSVAVLDLADDSSYEDEPLLDLLDEVVAPFRLYVERTYFGRDHRELRERVSA